MRKKKIIEAAVKQLEKENARRSTLTITQDGITINGAARPNTFTISNAGTVSFEQMANAVENLGKALIAVPYPDTAIDPFVDKYWHEAKDDTPKEFHPLLCTRCGGNLAFKNEFLVCEYCGTVYSSALSILEKPQERYEEEEE